MGEASMRGDLKLFTGVGIIKDMLAKKRGNGSDIYPSVPFPSVYIAKVIVNLHDEHAILRH